MAALRVSRAIFSLFSLTAVIVSVLTLYITELRRAEIDVFVSETAYLGRDANGSAEVVLAPLTIVNTGAREGVVREITLTVERLDAAGASTAERTFFAAHVGVAPGRGNTPFTPIAALRQTALSRPILFYPMRTGPWVLEAAGRYRLTLRYQVEAAMGPLGALEALWGGRGAEMQRRHSYEVLLPYMSVPELVDGGMIRMSPADWAQGAGGAAQ